MLILNEGRTLFIGDETYAESVHLPTFWQWFAIYACLAITIPLLGIWSIDPNAFRNPVAIIATLLISGILLSVVVVVRHMFILIAGDNDLVAAAFERDSETIKIIFAGLFGLTQQAIPFSEVQSFRSGRGEWDGVRVKQQTIVHFHSGRSIALPNHLMPKELALLKVLTGLRGS